MVLGDAKRLRHRLVLLDREEDEGGHVLDVIEHVLERALRPHALRASSSGRGGAAPIVSRYQAAPSATAPRCAVSAQGRRTITNRQFCALLLLGA